MWRGGCGGEWTGVVSDPGPAASSLGTGIILPSEPSPHWRVSRLGFSLGLALASLVSLSWYGRPLLWVVLLFIEPSVMTARCQPVYA